MPEKFRCAAYMDMYNQVDKTYGMRISHRDYAVNVENMER